MTKRIFAAILLLALFAGSASAFDAIALFGWPPADGSISTVKLDELDYIPFDITAEPPAYAEGRLFWDKDNGCLGVYPDVNGPILQVGQEFWARVKNEEVATMTNGTVVYLDPPTTGKDPVAKLAQANASATACMLGVVTHDISPDSTGFVTIQGLVRGLHNSEFTAGQRVYLSATTPGSYTASVPAAPNFPVKVGHVVKAHDGAGVLYVKQQLNGAFERAQFADGANFNGNVLIATSTDDGANKLQVNGFTKLGEAATGIKMKVLRGVTASVVASSSIPIPTGGIPSSKIISFSIVVDLDGSKGSIANADAYSEADVVSTTIVGTNAYVYTGGAATNMLSKNFEIVIWYKE